MKKTAKCYGVWGEPYYRTEDGHTFSIRETASGKIVFYYGNVITGQGTLKMLDDEEKKLLFEKVEFID